MEKQQCVPSYFVGVAELLTLQKCSMLATGEQNWVRLHSSRATKYFMLLLTVMSI